MSAKFYRSIFIVEYQKWHIIIKIVAEKRNLKNIKSTKLFFKRNIKYKFVNFISTKENFFFISSFIKFFYRYCNMNKSAVNAISVYSFPRKDMFEKYHK
jgi:hypothetical protein